MSAAGGGSERPGVLLLHGQPGGARDWAGVVAAVGDRARVVAFDRPGWNGSDPATGIEGNARAALCQLDQAHIGRAVLTGHSLGAAIAVRLAVRHPERVAALVLVGPAVNDESLYALDRWLALPGVGEASGAALLAGAGLALGAGPVRRRLSRRLGLEQSYLTATGRRFLRPASWRSFAAEQRSLIRELPELEAELGEVAAPTTIVAGTRDRVVPAAAARRLAAQIPNARLVAIEGAGHLLPQSQPARLAEQILAAA